MEALWDRDVPKEEMHEIAHRIWITMRMFNVKRYGDKKPIEFDQLPKRLMEEPLPSGRAEGSKSFVDKDDYNKCLQLVYQKRGLDVNGIPRKDELKRLGIT
jgi:aldehyde:ferredoxin oxidoreductase